MISGDLLARTCVCCVHEKLFRPGFVPSSTAGSLIRGIPSVEDRVAAVTIACSLCSNEEDGPRLGTQ